MYSLHYGGQVIGTALFCHVTQPNPVTWSWVVDRFEQGWQQGSVLCCLVLSWCAGSQGNNQLFFLCLGVIGYLLCIVWSLVNRYTRTEPAGFLNLWTRRACASVLVRHGFEQSRSKYHKMCRYWRGRNWNILMITSLWCITYLQRLLHPPKDLMYSHCSSAAPVTIVFWSFARKQYSLEAFSVFSGLNVHVAFIVLAKDSFFFYFQLNSFLIRCFSSHFKVAKLRNGVGLVVFSCAGF